MIIAFSVKKVNAAPGGETPIYRDARWKIQIKPLRETNVGVAQASTDP